MKTTTTVAEQKTEPSMEDILSSIRDIISGDSQGESQPEKMAAAQNTTVDASVPGEDQDILDLIHMLRDDGSVEDVLPHGKGPELAAKGKKSKKETEAEKSLEDLAAELGDEVEAEEAPAPKKKIPPSEEKALEEIAQTLSEMEQDQEAEDLEDLGFEKFAQAVDNATTEVEEAVTADFENDDLLSEDALSEAADALDALNDLAESVTNPTYSDPVGDKTVEALMKEILRPLLKEWLDANLPSMVRTVVNEQVEKVVQQRVKGGRSSGMRKAS